MPSSATEPEQSKWWAIRWMVAIWLLGWLGMIAGYAIRNTDVMGGAMIGLLQGTFISPFLLIVNVPLGAVGLAIGKIGKLRSYRTAISLVLASAISIVDIGSAIYQRATPKQALQRWTGVAFPQGATIHRHSYFGGGLADARYVFVFTCSAEETGRLIRELELSGNPFHEAYSRRPEIDLEVWQPAEDWSQADGKGSADYLELITDSTRTKVYLAFGQI